MNNCRSGWIAECELFVARSGCLFVPGNTANRVAHIEWVECVPEWAVKRAFGAKPAAFHGRVVAFSDPGRIDDGVSRFVDRAREIAPGFGCEVYCWDVM